MLQLHFSYLEICHTLPKILRLKRIQSVNTFFWLSRKQSNISSWLQCGSLSDTELSKHIKNLLTFNNIGIILVTCPLGYSIILLSWTEWFLDISLLQVKFNMFIILFFKSMKSGMKLVWFTFLSMFNMFEGNEVRGGKRCFLSLEVAWVITTSLLWHGPVMVSSLSLAVTSLALCVVFGAVISRPADVAGRKRSCWHQTGELRCHFHKNNPLFRLYNFSDGW